MRKVLRFGVACIIGVLTTSTTLLAQTNPPPPEPQIRIDPGMHTAAINQIAVDTPCKLLATGSDDIGAAASLDLVSSRLRG
jgi:hypothetical protein